MKDDGSQTAADNPPVRQAGMLIGVSVPGSAGEGRAIDVLRSLGAADIERADGTLVDGDWKDFDPVAPPSLIENQPMQRP
jgi:hypothetical protein